MYNLCVCVCVSDSCLFGAVFAKAFILLKSVTWLLCVCLCSPGERVRQHDSIRGEAAPGFPELFGLFPLFLHLLLLSHMYYFPCVFLTSSLCLYKHFFYLLPSLLLQIMTERKNAKAMAGGSLQDRMQAGLDLPLQGGFHT